ncbi:MAG: PAS domain S-box protein, partial [Deltaproteobacteria bacterium]|nr:PAS domain S-box protein [Deltaproteobacteria bacterium]
MVEQSNQELLDRVKELEQEIHRLKLQEASMLESEERFSSILNIFEDEYFEVDLKGDFTFFNKSFLENSGFTRDELTGMSYKQFLDEMNRGKIFNVFNHVYLSREPSKVEFWSEIVDSKTKNIQRKLMESSVHLILDDNGEKIGFRGFMRNITDRY